MKEYDIKITEVLEKTVQVQADSREEAEAIASEKWNNSMYDMDSAEDYTDVSFQAGEERDISPPEVLDVLLVYVVVHLTDRVIERLSQTRADSVFQAFFQLTIQKSHSRSSYLPRISA